MATKEKLETRLMDVVIAYLYGSLDSEFFMKIPEGLKIDEFKKSRHIYSIKLQRSLHGLKQSGRSATDVDEGTIYLKTEFEMKDLRRTKYCLGIQVEHLSSKISLHQSTYTKKILNRFYMDKYHPLTTPIVVRSLEPDKDPFRQREEVLGPEIPYLGAIGALMYLANNTRPEIAFASRRRRRIMMNQNLMSLFIGLLGATITLSAYSQTAMSPTQCIGTGLFVLMFGLLVKEGFISF
ncbi:retrovirus-related Pol polyprotein from transposon TNT 1-94 [Apium graveolens]|uniref:retrovirus-related Pol polyprotein from transposon TNT 1-94 n=1 Tax=Apium graveolens TaxID=4045 RepID=UPI003D7B81F0